MPQHRLRVCIEVTREVNHGKQQIANLSGGRAFVHFGTIELGFDLIGFLANFSQHRARIVPVKSNFACLVLQFEGAGQSREGDRDPSERTTGLAGFVRSLFRRFDALP